MGHHLVDFFLFWLRASAKYELLKNDPTKQDSAIMGVESIIMSVVGVLAAVGFAWLAYLAFTVDGLAIILTFIFGLAAAIAAIASFFQLSISSLFYAIYQMRLNKRAIGKVALAISLTLILLAIVAVIVIMVIVSNAN